MPELEPAAGDEVGRTRVLGHVQRVLVAHVDDGGADLDAAWCGRRSRPATGTASASWRAKWWTRKYAPSAPSSSAATASSIDWRSASDADPHLRVRRLRPVPERQEPDVLHASHRMAGHAPTRASAAPHRPTVIPRGGPSRRRLAVPRTSTQMIARRERGRLRRRGLATASRGSARIGSAQTSRGAARTTSRVARVDRRIRSRVIRGSAASTANQSRTAARQPSRAAQRSWRSARRISLCASPATISAASGSARTRSITPRTGRYTGTSSRARHLDGVARGRSRSAEPGCGHAAAARSPGTAASEGSAPSAVASAASASMVRFASPASALAMTEGSTPAAAASSRWRAHAPRAARRSWSPTDLRRVLARSRANRWRVVSAKSSPRHGRWS